ncbi:MAG TPA: circadian clock KaiB family protein [Candidatus Sulfomarinibacteraceae bacterium]|nr:circadian clock KaiB family protein [Candidatus Sulfomarinibacteraceae bacterium]
MSTSEKGRPPDGDGPPVLRLYVAGNAPNSQRARANLERINGQYFDHRCQIEIIDVFEQPDLALQEGIIVTPTLLRLAPGPLLHIIGDLSDSERVLATLDHKQGER